MEAYDALLACASEVVQHGFLSDGIASGLSEAEISFLPSGRLGIQRDDRYGQASKLFRDIQGRQRMHNAAAEFSRHWSGRNAGSPSNIDLAQFNAADFDEFLVTVEELGNLVDVLVNFGFEQSDEEPQRFLREEVVDKLTAELSWDRNRINTVLDNFALRSRTSFIPEKRLRDVFPWRFTRKLSYLSRPLVDWRDDGQRYLIWGTRNLSRLGLYLVSQCMNGRYEADRPAMRAYIGTIRSQEPHKFGTEVAESIRRVHPNWTVEERVTSVGARRLQRNNGEEIGDVDVLAISPDSKTIYPIEVKDLSLARTPQEMASENERLFVGKKSDKSTMTHHLERAEWIKANLSHILARFGVSSRGRWTVEPLIVTSQPLMTALMRTSPIPVIDFGQLMRRLK